MAPQLSSRPSYIPDHYKLIYSKAQIEAAVGQVGQRVAEWAGDQTDNVLALCVLRGGSLFFADLVRALPFSVELGFVRARSYSLDRNGERSSAVDIRDDGLDLLSRRVLIIDDICDSGSTLLALHDHLSEKGAAEMRSAVLIQRVLPEAVYQPDFVAFPFAGDDWFVGYGMEDRNRYSNLDGVYSIQRDV